MPGVVALFGSGETSPFGGGIYEMLARRLASPLPISVLETPAGFELNSAQVAGRVADFIKVRLQNYHPQVEVIPARRKGSPHSPDDPAIVAPLLHSDFIFLGPGSPTYAVRQLKDSLAWQTLQARHRLGATVVFASAATVAAGGLALPVYEIYKVGEDPHWKPGLDFFGAYGLSLTFIPHWNNAEGGVELDTSHCFLGQSRYEYLLEHMPAGMTIVGIDEMTALVIDLKEKSCQVLGKDAVHMICEGNECAYQKGETFPLSALGNFRQPEPTEGIPARVWEQALEENRQRQQEDQPPVPDEVQALVEERQAARTRKDWAVSDALRKQIAALGWQVKDTPEGQQIDPLV
jgi:hypothetical protein